MSLNKKNAWRYAYEKLMDGSLSPERVLTDLLEAQREAQNALTRVKKGGKELEYHRQIKELSKMDAYAMSDEDRKAVLSELADFVFDKKVSTVAGLKRLEKEFFDTDEGKAILKANKDVLSKPELFKDYMDFKNKASASGKYDERKGKFQGNFAAMFYNAGAKGGSLYDIRNIMNVRNLNEVGEELYEKMYLWKRAGYPKDKSVLEMIFLKGKLPDEED